MDYFESTLLPTHGSLSEEDQKEKESQSMLNRTLLKMPIKASEYVERSP